MTNWLKAALAVLIVCLALSLGWWLAPIHPRPAISTPAQASAPVSVATALEGTDAGTEPAYSAQASPLSDVLCPAAMVWVSGEYCVAGFETPHGCRVPTATVGACVDEFEYPNQRGVRPAVMVTFAEAEQACAVEGKRLCRDSEWTMACRGIRVLSGCAFGSSGKQVHLERLWRAAETSRELERVDGRRASGSSHCVSSQGAVDLPGNVEEWVRADGSQGYDAVLKGGHFNKGSIGCERSVYSRQLDARSAFVGFRCCRDPLVSPP